MVFTVLSPPPPSQEATGWLLIVPRVPCHYVDGILPFGFYGTMARVLSSLVTMEALPLFLLSPTACQEGSSAEGQAALGMLAKPSTLDTALKDTVVRASRSYTPEPKQFEEDFSSRPVKRLNTLKQPF